MQQSIGEKIAFYRKQKNLTQEELGDKLNVSAQAVSKWENDVTAPDISALLPLSEILGISVDFLLGKEQFPTPTVDKRSIPTSEKLIKILIDSSDGDNVKICIPVAIVKILVSTGKPSNFLKTNNSAINDIDFDKVMELVDAGVIGEILTVNSSDGDVVRILVE